MLSGCIPAHSLADRSSHTLFRTGRVEPVLSVPPRQEAEGTRWHRRRRWRRGCSREAKSWQVKASLWRGLCCAELRSHISSVMVAQTDLSPSVKGPQRRVGKTERGARARNGQKAEATAEGWLHRADMLTATEGLPGGSASPSTRARRSWRSEHGRRHFNSNTSAPATPPQDPDGHFSVKSFPEAG